MADLHSHRGGASESPVSSSGIQDTTDHHHDEGHDQKKHRLKPPSFTDFWKRSKEKQGGRSLTFVSSNPTGSGIDNSSKSSDDATQSSADTAKEKALARRAQVRKAQVQHRQRKANYTKELEMDVACLRDQIYQTEAKNRSLRRENDAIRQQLSRGVDPNMLSPNSIMGFQQQGVQQPPQQTVADDSRNSIDAVLARWNDNDTAMLDLNLDDYMVSLDFNDLMGTPALNVSWPTSASNGGSKSMHFGGSSTPAMFSPEMATTASPPTDFMSAEAASTSASASPGLSQDETDRAVNFILTLEHVCWDHFSHSHFTHTDYNASANETGHHLLVSSIALQRAPEHVFGRMSGLQKELCSDPESRPWTGDLKWQASGLSLESLRGLAASLNPPEKELTPVQAWFELVRVYGMRTAQDRAVVEALAREFRGVVRCLHFGAVIERDAFDSVVQRVVRDCGYKHDRGHAQTSGVGVEV